MTGRINEWAIFNTMKILKIIALAVLLIGTIPAMAAPSNLVTSPPPVVQPVTNAPSLQPVQIVMTNSVIVQPDAQTMTLLKEATKDKWWETAANIVLGAAIAALFGYLQSRHAHNREVEQKKLDDDEFKDNVLRAINLELHCLDTFYNSEIGADLKRVEKGQVLESKLGLTTDFFAVFDANAVHLGKLSTDASRQIVIIYAAMKGLIELFRINNGYLDAREDASFQILQRGQDTYYTARLKKIEDLLGKQTNKLKEADKALKVIVDQYKQSEEYKKSMQEKA